MTSPQTVRVAAAQYPVHSITEADQLAAKLDRWIAEAAAAGAKLVAFPEFAGMEFASLADRRRVSDRRDLARHKLGPLPVAVATRRKEPSPQWETAAVQAALPKFMEIHAELAARHNVYILAGSLPVLNDPGGIRNRAYFFGPSGHVGHQDKIVPTRWEREVWDVRSGDQIRTQDTDFGPVGIAICYDVEFPMVARLQAEAGARIILAPCCCDSLRGYYRVRVGARARALENQAYVIQTPTVGEAAWSSTIGTCIGAAGIYGPPDLGPNVNGVIAQGVLGQPGWTYADLDLRAVDRIRGNNGAIANAADWDSQFGYQNASQAPRDVSVATG